VYEIAILNPRTGHSKSKRKRNARKGVKAVAKKIKRNKKGHFVKGTAAPHRKRAKRKSAKRKVHRRKRPAGAKRATGAYTVGSAPIRRRKINPRRHSRRHQNPRLSVAGITSQLTNGAFGAAGALAVDVALGYIPLPAMLKAGYPKHAVRIGGALAIGWLASKFARNRAQAIGSGAMAIAVYGLLKDVVVQFAPNVKGLGDYEEVVVNGGVGDYFDSASPLAAYLTDQSGSDVGAGAYMGDGVGDMAGEF
jgi:hypothetical protein